MELRAYLKILLRGWWIVLSVSLVTVASTIVFSFMQTEIFQTRATFVVSPTASGLIDTLRGLDTLSRREGINATFAQLASSQAIFEAATQGMALTDTQLSNLDISSRVIPDTNVIELEVSGDSPTLVADIANRLGGELVKYIDQLYEAYNLKPLDVAKVPVWAISPNKKQNVALGILFGLVLGLGTTYVVDYLRSSEETVVTLNIMDGETGAYNKQYFLQRLNEEMSRSKHNGYPLSLAMMYINNLNMIQGINSTQVRTKLLRQAVSFINEHLKQEDVFAYLGDNKFGLLLLDTSGENARAILEYLENRLSWSPFGAESSDAELNLYSTSSVTAYGGNGSAPNDLLSKLNAVLENAKSGSNGEVKLITFGDEHESELKESAGK